jgi:hypothetical protein
LKEKHFSPEAQLNVQQKNPSTSLVFKKLVPKDKETISCLKVELKDSFPQSLVLL